MSENNMGAKNINDQSTQGPQWRIDAWFNDLSEETRAQLKKFHDELLRFNKTINLISARTTQNADNVHIADCVLASRIIVSAQNGIDEIYDFGSGNGLPGIVFGILNPTIKVHLVDSDQRKGEFLKHTISVLELKNIFVMVRAVEDLPNGSVKFAMSRGFAPISKSILAARKALCVGGTYFHLKSEEWATEISKIPTQLCTFWTPSLVGEYKLPQGEVKYAIVKTDRVSS